MGEDADMALDHCNHHMAENAAAISLFEREERELKIQLELRLLLHKWRPAVLTCWVQIPGFDG